MRDSFSKVFSYKHSLYRSTDIIRSVCLTIKYYNFKVFIFYLQKHQLNFVAATICLEL